MSRELENKARVTIDGKRYRMGNPNHPFHDLYQQQGPEAVYRKMGLVEGHYSKSKYTEVEYDGAPAPKPEGVLKGMTAALAGLALAIIGTICIGVFLG